MDVVFDMRVLSPAYPFMWGSHQFTPMILSSSGALPAVSPTFRFDDTRLPAFCFISLRQFRWGIGSCGASGASDMRGSQIIAALFYRLSHLTHNVSPINYKQLKI